MSIDCWNTAIRVSCHNRRPSIKGEFTAAEQLANAAERLAREPAAIQLRYLQTLSEISVEQNSTIIFPVPVDIFKGIATKLGISDEDAAANAAAMAEAKAAHKALSEDDDT